MSRETEDANAAIKRLTRERDEALQAFRNGEAAVQRAMQQVGEAQLALAAREAENATLREALERVCVVADWARDTDAFTVMQAALSRAPGGDEALRAATEQAVAAEREACAKAPAGGSNQPPGLVHEDDPFSAYNRGWADGVRDLRAAIRARGKEGE